MPEINFTTPTSKCGKKADWIAYASERRADTFIVAQKTGYERHNRPLMCVLTPRSPHAQACLPNFIGIKVTALYEDDDITVHGVEITVSWRGIEKFKAIYSVTDCNSEILFNRWSK